MLFHNAPAPYDDVNKPLLIGFAVGLGAIWAFALTKAVQVRRSPVAVGPQTIVGEVGEARRDDLVFVHGELWRARPAGGEPLKPGQRVRVAGVDPGLVLQVEQISD
jgi:membrane-bound ClpP family serine protease